MLSSIFLKQDEKEKLAAKVLAEKLLGDQVWVKKAKAKVDKDVTEEKALKAWALLTKTTTKFAHAKLVQTITNVQQDAKDACAALNTTQTPK